MISPKHWNTAIAGLGLCLLLGCASDISLDAEKATPDERVLPGPGGEQIRIQSHAQAYYQGRVDAAGEDWVYFDLDSQSQLQPLEPSANDDWDVAFRGSDIKLNGGESGTPPNALEVVVYADKVATDQDYPWLQLSAAPPATTVSYYSDAPASGLISGNPADPDSAVDYAFKTYPAEDQASSPATGAGDYGWMNYSGYLAGSKITPRRNVGYIVRTTQCRYVSLRMTGYYDEQGQSAQLAFDWRELPGRECAQDAGGADLGKLQVSPSADGQLATVDAESEESWVYIDLLNGLQVQPQNPQQDSTWDIAVRRSDIKMNGGSSGAQDVALHDMLRADWDQVSGVPSAAEFHQDQDEVYAFVEFPVAERQGEQACGGINGDHGWYYYSGFCNDGNGQHYISPRDVVYILKGRQNQHWKLRLLGYYDQAGNAGHPQFEFAPIAP